MVIVIFAPTIHSCDAATTFSLLLHGVLARMPQARFVPTLVLERLRAVGEAAAVPKKSLSGGIESTGAVTAAAAAAVVEGCNSPQVGVSC